MAALGVSMGACFLLRVHKSLVESVCAHLELTDFLPTELRYVLFRTIRAQELRPWPTFAAAVSALDGDYLGFYIFIGNDTEGFGSVADLQATAADLQEAFRHDFGQLIPEDCAHLALGLSVTWEPNLLVTTE
uniref:ORF30 n=1 Tax=Canine adenovirus serotype 1 TaxID=10512 RepID=A0A1D8GZ22_ADEC1|nr:ORF30 [Canine adenovirus 1]